MVEYPRVLTVGGPALTAPQRRVCSACPWAGSSRSEPLAAVLIAQQAVQMAHPTNLPSTPRIRDLAGGGARETRQSARPRSPATSRLTRWGTLGGSGRADPDRRDGGRGGATGERF